MAGGRRTTGRNPRSPPTPVVPANSAANKPITPGSREEELLTPQPVPLPDIPHDSQLTFEVLIYMYVLAGLGLQYLNLYRSVWWLPHSYNNSAVNFYLIDPSLIAFSAIVLGRRLYWLGLRAGFIYCLGVSPTGRFLVFSKYCYAVLVLCLLGYLAYLIMLSHSLVTILYLVYPSSLYIILFGLSLSPLVDLLPGSQGRVKIYKDKAGIYRTNLAAAGGMPTSPELIRMEVAITRADFNGRLKQVLFNALLNAYFAGFIPCLFSQGYLQYEFWWVSQHCLILFIGSITLYLVQVFPAGYHNLLHRCVLGLGYWQKMTGRLSPAFYNTWTAGGMWPIGSIVRHGKDLFRAEGYVNTAEPSNSQHARYYYLFCDPSVGTGGVLVLQVVLVTWQLVTLLRSHVWYHLISQAILLFIHYYTLFKLCRDYLVLSQVYKAEQLLQGRSQAKASE